LTPKPVPRMSLSTADHGGDARQSPTIAREGAR
jgi:hypothetical protein